MKNKCIKSVEKIDQNLRKILQFDEYIFEKNNEIALRMRYFCTGTTIVLGLSQYEASQKIFYASSDFRLEDNSNKYRNKVAIWFDESNIQYVDPSINEKVRFENFEPGKVYQMFIGYINENNEYIRDSVYVETWGIKISLVKNGSMYVTCNLTSNYFGEFEFWSDQDSNKRSLSTLDYNESINFKERLHEREYITIYAQVKDMPDTLCEIPKIYIPFLFKGFRSEVSGSTAKILPLIECTSTIGLKWIIGYNNKIYSGNINDYAKIDNLNMGQWHELTCNIIYTNTEDSGLDYNDAIDFKIKTYGINIVSIKEININYASIELEQTKAELIIEDNDNLDLLVDTNFSDKEYGALVYKLINEESNEYDTSVSLGEYETSDNNLYISNLEPVTSYRLYAYLINVRSCIDNKNDAITYVDFTTQDVVHCDLPEITVTGSTCKVLPVIKEWNYSLKLIYSFNIRNANGIGYQSERIVINSTDDNIESTLVTNLHPGQSYYVQFEAKDNYGNIIVMPNVSIKTYGINASVPTNSIHSTFVDNFVFTYVNGMKNFRDMQLPIKKDSCRYYLTSAEDIMEYIIYPKKIPFTNDSDSCYQEFDNTEYKLKPNTEYILWTYIDSIKDYNGELDTLNKFIFRTAQCAKNIRHAESFTGTTISVYIDWDEPSQLKERNYITNIYAEIYDSNNLFIDRKVIHEPDEIKFINLDNGKKYTIVIYGNDSEGNSTSDYMTFKDNNPSEFEVITYQLKFTQLETSTRALRFKVDLNYPLPENNKIEYALFQDNEEIISWDEHKTVDIDQLRQYPNLKQDSSIELCVRLNNIFDENGDLDVITYTNNLRTKIFSIEILDSETDINSALLTWQAYSNDYPISRDFITNFKIRPIIEECRAWKDAEVIHVEYYPAEYTKDENKLLFDNLHHDAGYKFVIAITDGYNTITSKPFTKKTTSSVIRIYDSLNNKWIKAVPFIYHNNRFIKSECYLYTKNHWRLTI